MGHDPIPASVSVLTERDGPQGMRRLQQLLSEEDLALRARRQSQRRRTAPSETSHARRKGSLTLVSLSICLSSSGTVAEVGLSACGGQSAA